MHYCNLLVTK